MSTLPDEIRKALEKPDGVSEETMAPLASRYDEEVRAVNERLDEAVALLRKNLRSEAIQSANRRPNVMEAAVALDFAERIEWQEILLFLGMPVPQLLDHDKVQQINEAIVETQPIEELLKQHRKLAIAKAPLSWRLKVLRRIADIDAMNPIWMDDVEDYETARRKTLAQEVDTALKQNNASQIASLQKELSQTNWVTPPPAELLHSLTTALATNAYNQKVESMRLIASNLHNAFSEFNEQEARRLWAEWTQSCNGLNGPIPTDLSDEIAPTQTWLSELDLANATSQQRSEAVRGLTQAMNRSRDLTTLRRAYANAQKFDEPVPPEIEQRFQNLTQEIELSHKRKTLLKITSIVTAAILIAGLVTFWQYRQVKETRLATAVSQFSEFVNGNQLAEASSFWKSLQQTDPDLTEEIEMRSLYSKLAEKLATEQQRIAQFKFYIEKANNEDDSLIDEDALEEADKLAVGAIEKAEVFELQQRLQKYQEQLAAEDTQAALAAVESLTTRFIQISQQPLGEVDLGELKNVLTELGSLRQRYPLRSSQVDAQIKVTTDRAESLENAVEDYLAKERRLAAAFRPMLAAKNLAEYRIALAGYIENIDTPDLEKEFNRTLQERDSWERGLESNELPTALRLAITGGLDAKEIQAILTLQTKLAGQSGQNPLLTTFQNVTKATFNDSGNPEEAMATLKEELSLLPQADLVSVEVALGKDGNVQPSRFFVYNDDFLRSENRLKQSATMSLQHVADSDGGVTSSTITGPASRVHVEPGRSFQWLSRELENRSADFDNAWGTTFLTLIADVRGRQDLDGLLKEELIFRLLTACTNGSDSMKGNLTRAIRTLASRADTRQQWYEPDRPSDKLATAVESEVIPSLKEAYNAISERLTKLTPATQLRYQWTGFLARDSAGKINPRINVTPAQPGLVYIMCATISDPTKVDILPVGSWNGTDIQLQPTSGELSAGRPLFMLQTNN
jgi:hypothetical protein